MNLPVVINNNNDTGASPSEIANDPNQSQHRTTQDRSSWKPRASFTESIQSLFRRKGRKTFPVARKSNPETPTMLRIKHYHRGSHSTVSRIVTNSDTSVLPVEQFETNEHLKTRSNDAIRTPPSATRRAKELPPLKLTHMQLSSSERLDSPSVTRDQINMGMDDKIMKL